MITQEKVEYLFDVLWLGMEYCQDHRANCLKLYPQIEKQFLKHKLDFDTLLHELIKYDGIKVTIATGLIWAAYPGRAVPFDKHTTSWCYKLGWIKSDVVSKNYKEICKNIIVELKEYRWADGSVFTVQDLVREALDEAEDMEWEMYPK